MSDFRRKLAPLVSQICDRIGVSHLLDYYCGDDPIMSHIKVGHKMRVQCYDPKIERFKDSALTGEMVFYCPDVEPEISVIETVELLTGAVCLFALKTDDPEKWINPLVQIFDMQTFQRVEDGFYAILYCKPHIKIETLNGDNDIR